MGNFEGFQMSHFCPYGIGLSSLQEGKGSFLEL